MNKVISPFGSISGLAAGGGGKIFYAINFLQIIDNFNVIIRQAPPIIILWQSSPTF